MKNNVQLHKHLSLDDRTEIEECLCKGMTFKAIARRISKCATTVSYEIKQNFTLVRTSYPQKDKDGNLLTLCPKLLKAPYVCNSCKRFKCKCTYDKRKYIATQAHKLYKERLTSSREGIPLNQASFYSNDDIIYEKTMQGQRLYHIIQSNDLKVSKSTLYRHLHKGYLSISPLDTPRIVKFKPRKTEKETPIPKALKIGRTYDDFLDFIQINDISHWVEMDTVIGSIGGKTLLTFTFNNNNFFIAYLLENKTAHEVSFAISNIKQSLSRQSFNFGDIFSFILTDNGSEFANVTSIENSIDIKDKDCKMYFCDANASWQKPHVEKNHTILRDYLPKGTSFDNLNQDIIDKVCSHINSIKRKSLNGKSSYEVFSFMFSKKLCSALNIEEINPIDVIQSPKLIKDLLKK